MRSMLHLVVVLLRQPLLLLLLLLLPVVGLILWPGLVPPLTLRLQQVKFAGLCLLQHRALANRTSSGSQEPLINAFLVENMTTKESSTSITGLEIAQADSAARVAL